MEDYKEIFKREFDRINYVYAKVNTKSKKKKIAYDLIFFEDMYNSLVGDKIEFPWINDEVIMNVRKDVNRCIVQNILDNQIFLIDLIEHVFNMFLENEFSVYMDYGKEYHRISEGLMQRYIIEMYSHIDKKLCSRFINKFNNLELFVNNSIEKYDGLFFPIESLSKNIIFITARNYMTVEEGRILVHEMGHDFELENALNNGENSIWNNIVKTIYPEVASSFFEYAYINYLIENNLYKEDAMRLKRSYLNQIYYYFSYALIILSHREINLDNEFNVVLNDFRIIEYGNELLELMNSSDNLYQEGDKLKFRSPFIYGLGKLLGIYIYNSYKNNPKEFLSNFKTSLLEYKDSGMMAFSHLGITEESLIKGDVLKKALKECK